jgi:hypothetical protein
MKHINLLPAGILTREWVCPEPEKNSSQTGVIYVIPGTMIRYYNCDDKSNPNK